MCKSNSSLKIRLNTRWLSCPHQPLEGRNPLSFRGHACPVLAFQVEDVRAARKELESRGVEFVTDVDGNESEAWAYFRGPDGYL